MILRIVLRPPLSSSSEGCGVLWWLLAGGMGGGVLYYMYGDWDGGVAWGWGYSMGLGI